MKASEGCRAVLCALTCWLSVGCVQQPANPSFPVTRTLADRDFRRMAEDRKPFDRPLVIVSGFLDPGLAAWSIESRCCSITTDPRVVAIALGDCTSLDDCSRKITDAVQRSFPCSKRLETVEVDVIGYSLGGLAARYAAAPVRPTDRRLRIARLFTISSPNRGADEAKRLPLLHPIQAEMRPDSPAIRRLNAVPTVYAVVSYIRLGDRAIGIANAALPGVDPWWLPTPPLEDAHSGAFADPRILADIGRRLRGETPFAVAPATAPPGAARAVNQ